ncbi:disease resistance protein RPM1-like [Oryza brachyantha]|uniref:NB-ARC domain-containing protein n=1 Tax=Oryza brachyantha TaxID=4533 RepID=J3MRZ0_ORYBR|nr:disease resistance protein RPM1-like [Oryza brachyantha]
MAESVILFAVKKIGVALGTEAINQATSYFKKYVIQLTELQGSMGRIRRELRLMHEFLCRMDVRNRNNQTYEIWVEEVRVLVHGIEDIVDEYLHLVGQKLDTGCRTYLKKGIKRPNVMVSLSRIASSVKEAEANLVHLFQAKDRWVLLPTDNSSYIVERSQHLAATSRSICDEDLVGVDNDKTAVTQWLQDDVTECLVVALLGMGGLGKTALAANVYRREKEKFECRAWVTISQTYSRVGVLRNLIEELFKDKEDAPTDIATMDVFSLEAKLKSFLQEKKYLIVLDDVWTPEVFVELSNAFVRNNKGSRLVITTRESNVASLASQSHVLTLKALPNDKAMELFRKKAFPSDTDEECLAQLGKLSEEIVGKCKGLPLAIVSVGSLLFVREKTIEEWRRINDQLSWEIINNPRLDHVRNVLLLSFIYLPSYLKSCFLYCSLFPEDYPLKRKKLVRLWVAEGFIVEKGESTMEEVAEGYLKELVHRNMLQLVQRNSFGRIKTFKMHDIVRDLAVDLCRRECFGVAYEDGNHGRSLEENDERRLVIHKFHEDVGRSVLGVCRLRSIIALDKSTPPSTILPSVLDNSRYMSVLELSGLPIETVPGAIGDLFNLRHLGLRGSKVKLLPESVEKLSNLLTLDLSGSEIRRLPRGIVKLRKLRHLFAEKLMDATWRDFRCCTGVRIHRGLGNLTSLQTLQGLEAQEGSITHLGELRHLRSIRVWNVRGAYCGRLCASLVKLRFLSNLYIVAGNENEALQLQEMKPTPPKLERLFLRGRLAQGTLQESPLFLDTARLNLHELRLYWSQLEQDPLQSLSLLSNLTDLRLTKAYTGHKMVFLPEWFPNLTILWLRDMPGLEELEVQEGAMKKLQRLTLVNLTKLAEVPPGIEFLKTLQYLGFLEITQNFLNSLQSSPRIANFRWQYSLRDSGVAADR